ncbi:hypothetical protein V2J09_021164, partial [Rumex salicifolius]
HRTPSSSLLRNSSALLVVHCLTTTSLDPYFCRLRLFIAVEIDRWPCGFFVFIVAATRPPVLNLSTSSK